MPLQTRQPEFDPLSPPGGKRATSQAVFFYVCTLVPGRSHTPRRDTPSHWTRQTLPSNTSCCFGCCRRSLGQVGDTEEAKLKDTQCYHSRFSTRTAVGTKPRPIRQAAVPSVQTSALEYTPQHGGLELPLQELSGDAPRPQQGGTGMGKERGACPNT